MGTAGGTTFVSAIQLQVAFAGHNREPELGDLAELRVRVAEGFAMLTEAGLAPARLLTGLAHGADRVAVQAWNEAGLGQVHAVFPFLPAASARADPADLSATWLDGARTEDGGRSAHLAQSRWILAQADLLVVVWSGERARGAGGTADTVRLAITAGLPVIWITPGSVEIRLVRATPEALQEFDFAEWLDGLRDGHPAMIEPASAEGLRAIFARTGARLPPAKGESRLARWLHLWLWRTYPLFQRVTGGRAAPPAPQEEIPPDLADQPGFKTLTEAYLASDLRATRLSAVHRSEQILLLAAAVFAATVGSAPSIWPLMKLPVVLLELGLALAAFAVWWTAAHARRHERWTDERRLAEQIRLERAAWALGLSTRGAGSPATRDEHQRLGRPILRQASPPAGVMDAERMGRWTVWATREVIGGQIAYHRQQAARNGRIAHRIGLAEDAAFGLLVLALAGFAVADVVSHRTGTHLPAWFGGLVLMASVVMPAVGAAALALEAKLEFGEQAERSHSVATRLQKILHRLDATQDVGAARGAIGSAFGWVLTEADQWREGAGRRRLFRGG